MFLSSLIAYIIVHFDTISSYFLMYFMFFLDFPALFSLAYLHVAITTSYLASIAFIGV